ncbi:hypothetical protein E3Q05_02310 [Wallemia mellicola]|nr:hypothetical protein E3Q05_02310 [Wallemia mellicola]
MSNLISLVNNTKDIPFLTSFSDLSISDYLINTQRNSLSFNVNLPNDINDVSPQLNLVVPAEYSWDIHTSSDCKVSVKRYENALSIQVLPIQFSSLSIEKTTGAPSSIRYNGIIKPATSTEDQLLGEALPRSSAHKFHANSIMQELSNVSHQDDLAPSEQPAESSMTNKKNVRTQNQASEIASLIRRNYIYFSSLLQEPEAKWKHISDNKGVSITQLDTIDPTLVLYRAQAIFIGVNIFDIFAVFESYGSRVFWDKTFEDATLLEDINNTSNLWYFKTKPVWPANARDNVLVTTSYKSMSSIHCFGFTAHDTSLFPSIPPMTTNLIRSQTDLSGVAIESLSPTTVQVTILEQSDPKGWQNKSGIPQILTQQLSGIGEFAIKYGGPPILTDITNGRALTSHYDHDKANYKLEYEMILPFDTLVPVQSQEELHPNRTKETFTITCLLRCDLDIWANSIDVIIDPPATDVDCIRRHRLSAKGGGVWITIKHKVDPSNEQYDIFDSKLAVNILKSKKEKDRGNVYVNGIKVPVEVEEISEEAVTKLKAMKRHPPSRVPLDTLAEKQLEVNEIDPVEGWSTLEKKTDESASEAASTTTSKDIPTKYTSKLGNVAETPVQSPSSFKEKSSIHSQSLDQDATTTTKHKEPMRRALDSLSWTRRIHDDLNNSTVTTSSALKSTLSSQKQQLYGSSVSTTGSIASNSSNTDLVSAESSKNTNWNVIYEKDDLTIKRKLFHALSNDIPVQVGQRIIEGWSVNEVASAIQSSFLNKSTRDSKTWDNERIVNNLPLEMYTSGSFSSYLTLRTTFPFKDRAFFTSTISSNINGKRYITSASIDPSLLAAHNFNESRLNKSRLPYGKILIDSWVLEEVDPYSTEKLLIPSTNVSHYVAVDYCGNVPSTVNNLCNTLSVKVLNNLDSYLTNNGPPISLLKPIPTFSLNKNSEIPDEVSLREGELSWVIDKPKKGEVSVVLSNKYDGQHNIEFGHGLLSTEEIDRQAGMHKLADKEDTIDDIEIDQLSPTLPERSFEQQQQQQSRNVTPSNLAKRASSMSLKVPTGSNTQMRSISGASTSTIRRSDFRNNFDNLLQALRFGRDYILAELVVDLQLYTGGISVDVQSRVSDEALPLSTTQNTVDEMAIDLNVFNLSSSLDPARVRHKQLLRLVLKCGSLKDSFRVKLLNHHKLVTTFNIKSADELTPTKEVLYNGSSMDVKSEKLSMQDLLDDVKYELLDCIPLSNSNVDTAIPPSLLNPLAISGKHLKGVEREEVVEQAEPTEPAAEEGVKDETKEETKGEIVSSNSLMSIFNSNSNIFSNFTSPSFPSLQSMFSMSKTPEPPKEEDNSLIENEVSQSTSSSPSPENYKTPEGIQSSVHSKSTSPISQTSSAEVETVNPQHCQQAYTPTSLGLVFLLTAVTFFLLGSLVRSLISPDDYVVYVSNNGVDLEQLANSINYKVIKKVIQFKIPFINNEIIFGFS